MGRLTNSIFAAAICVVAVGCCPSPTPQDQTTGDAPTTTAPLPPSAPSPNELVQSERPADQVRLEALLKKVNDAEEGSGNAINDKANFIAAYHAYCSEMQKDGKFTDWTARVDGIYAGNQNDETPKKPSISLVTPGGLKIFEEFDQRSRIYKAVLRLKEGDYVRFSIAINHIEPNDLEGRYDECHDPDYDSPRGPLVNTFLSGDLLTLSPIS